MGSILYESYYTQNLSAVSVTSSSYSDIISRTFSPLEVQDFFFFGTGDNQTRASDSTNTANWRLLLNSSPTLTHERNTVQNDIPQPGGMGFFYKENLPLGSYFLKTQQSANANSIQSRDNRVLAIGGLNMVAGNAYISSVSVTTIETTTSSVTFTPDAGDYLIFASAVMMPSSSGNCVAKVTLDGDEKTIGRAYRGGLGALNRSLFMVKKETLGNTSHTLAFTCQAEGGSTSASLREQYLAVIKI